MKYTEKFRNEEEKYGFSEEYSGLAALLWFVLGFIFEPLQRFFGSFPACRLLALCRFTRHLPITEL